MAWMNFVEPGRSHSMDYESNYMKELAQYSKTNKIPPVYLEIPPVVELQNIMLRFLYTLYGYRTTIMDENNKVDANLVSTGAGDFTRLKFHEIMRVVAAKDGDDFMRVLGGIFDRDVVVRLYNISLQSAESNAGIMGLTINDLRFVTPDPTVKTSRNKLYVERINNMMNIVTLVMDEYKFKMKADYERRYAQLVTVCRDSIHNQANIAFIFKSHRRFPWTTIDDLQFANGKVQKVTKISAFESKNNEWISDDIPPVNVRGIFGLMGEISREFSPTLQIIDGRTDIICRDLQGKFDNFTDKKPFFDIFVDHDLESPINKRNYANNFMINKFGSAALLNAMIEPRLIIIEEMLVMDCIIKPEKMDEIIKKKMEKIKALMPDIKLLQGRRAREFNNLSNLSTTLSVEIIQLMNQINNPHV